MGDTVETLRLLATNSHGCAMCAMAPLCRILWDEAARLAADGVDGDALYEALLAMIASLEDVAAVPLEPPTCNP